MFRTRRRSFFSPRPRTSSIPPISALGWCPDRSTIRIALLPPNSWSYQDDESRRSNVTVRRKNDNFCDTPIKNLLCQRLAVKATRMEVGARPSAVTGNSLRSSWHRLAEAEQIALAVFKPSRSLTYTLPRIVPLDIGDPIHCFQAGQVVFLKHHPTRSERGYSGFDVGNLPRQLGVIAGGCSRGLEQGEVAATAAVTKSSGPLLDGFQPEFFRIESPGPIEIANWKASCDLRLCQHFLKPPLVNNVISTILQNSFPHCRLGRLPFDLPMKTKKYQTKRGESYVRSNCRKSNRPGESGQAEQENHHRQAKTHHEKDRLGRAHH